jgi:hypothetical protein
MASDIDNHSNLGFPFYAFWFACFWRHWNDLTFQYFNFERTRWRFFQKRGMCIKLDTYVFIQRDKLYILPTVLIENTIVHNKQYIITNFIISFYDVQENSIDIKRQAEIFSLFAHVIHLRAYLIGFHSPNSYFCILCSN